MVGDTLGQPLLAAMILSMIATLFLIGASDRIVLRFASSEWLLRSLEMHRVAVRSLETGRHVIILGYGRNGQHVARLLDAEGVPYMALDLDPGRVREAALAGDTVVFADFSRCATSSTVCCVACSMAQATMPRTSNPRNPACARRLAPADVGVLQQGDVVALLCRWLSRAACFGSQPRSRTRAT